MRVESFADTRVALLENILENIDVEAHSCRSISSLNNPNESRSRTAKLSSDIKKLKAVYRASIAFCTIVMRAGSFVVSVERSLALREKRVQLLRIDARASLVALALTEIAVYWGEM